MRFRRSLAAATLATVCALAAGCGSSTAIPGGPTIRVPHFDVPSLPGADLSKIDFSRQDAASAKKAVCVVADVWLKANTATKKVIRPAVDKVIGHYANSPDSNARAIAATAKALVQADATSDSVKRVAWRKLCPSA